MRKVSLGSYLISPFAVQTRAYSSPLLPFLYQTRTLLSEPKITRRLLHAAKNRVNNHDKRMRTFCSTSPGQVDADQARRPKADPIAFVDPDHGQIPDNLSSHTEPQAQNQPSRPSTVTASEQAVFDRLFEEVSPPTTLEPDEEDIVDQDESISGDDLGANLDSIFDDAIRRLQRQEEEAAKIASRRLLFANVPRLRAIDTLIPDGERQLSANSFIRPLKLADGTMLGDEIETEEERARLEVACKDHRALVNGMLDSADSDVQIWQVLEQEVFSLITHLDEHIKLVEKAKKEKALHAVKVRKAEAEGKDIAEVKLEKGDLAKREDSSLNLTHSKAIPLNNLLSILHRNYGECCLNALRLLRRNYPTSSYALNVLSTIKQRGSISYVLGASTDIYNETLFLLWTQYSDLHGMADMIEEMRNQGIEGNEVTRALIKGVAKQRRFGRLQLRGPVVKRYWHLRGTIEGWRRVRDLFEKITQELAEREAMLADEAESEDGELETNKE